jgi:hypothetical protein
MRLRNHAIPLTEVSVASPASSRQDQPDSGTTSTKQRDARGLAVIPPRRGWGRAWAGRAATLPPVPAFRGSTAQVQGLYPWLVGGTLPAAGAYVGVDCLTGGSFSCHPLAWLAAGISTNPNMVITGAPGVGKSATIKALALRLMPYGVRSFIAGDLKNEYAPLARALGAEPVELGPGLPARLNPLDAGPLGESLPSDAAALAERLAEIHRRRLVLVCSLAAMRLGRPLTPTEESAVSLAIHEAPGRRRPGRKGTGLAWCSGERARPAPPPPPSPGSGRCCGTRLPAWRGNCGCGTTPSPSSGRWPARSPTRSAAWSAARSAACSTRRPRSHPTSRRRSKPWTCQGWPTGAMRSSR